jgi:aspartyl-tRNA(Asn)/glutamyl-tRNA(Gln) amidotransferase subunit B
MLFDANNGSTRPMRSKEESHDYRYFPDPDLPVLFVSEERIEKTRKSLPELPVQLESRFIKEFDLPAVDAAQLTSDRDLAKYFERSTQFLKKGTPKLAANWILSELAREVNDRSWNYVNCPISAQFIAQLVNAIGDGTISGKIAKTVFKTMVETGKDPESIIKEEGLVQISDDSAIRTLVEKIVNENPAQVAEFLSGKEKILGFFVGRIMKESGGKMNPATVNTILLATLSSKKVGS